MDDGEATWGWETSGWDNTWNMAFLTDDDDL